MPEPPPPSLPLPPRTRQVAELVNENCEAAAIWHVDGKLPDHTDKSNAVIAADQALFLVNGKYVPTLKFKANVWTRLRILFASVHCERPSDSSKTPALTSARFLLRRLQTRCTSSSRTSARRNSSQRMASTCTTRAWLYILPIDTISTRPNHASQSGAGPVRPSIFGAGHDRSSTPSLGSAIVRISSSSSPTDRACLVPSPRVALSVPTCRRCTEPDPNKYPNPTLLDGLLYNQNDNDVSDNSVTDVVCNAADAIPHVRSRAPGRRAVRL